MNLCSNQRVNNKNVIIAAIIALILINILDNDCIDSLSNILMSIGDLMQVGITSSCLTKCNDMRNFCCQ